MYALSWFLLCEKVPEFSLELTLASPFHLSRSLFLSEKNIQRHQHFSMDHGAVRHYDLCSNSVLFDILLPNWKHTTTLITYILLIASNKQLEFQAIGEIFQSVKLILLTLRDQNKIHLIRVVTNFIFQGNFSEILIILSHEHRQGY